MSTEIEEIKDCVDEKYSVEVGYGSFGIKVEFLEEGEVKEKIWLDVQRTKDLINALMTAIFASTDGKEQYDLSVLGG